MFAVIWRGAALDHLADAWVQADPPTRDAIDRAVQRLNAALAANPKSVGESRTGRRQVAFDAPCAISYVVDDPVPGAVRVTHFWTF
jgi:plasmid stabilization system protein ParE